MFPSNRTLAVVLKPARRYLRDIFVAGLVVTGAVVSLLFSPTLSREVEVPHCGKPIHIWGHAHLTVGCDSGEFVALAGNPALLLTPEHQIRQNRPLYSALGWAHALPFRPLGLESLGLRILGGEVTSESGLNYRKYLPEYLGFILLNWLLLVASVELFRRLLEGRSLLETGIVLPVAILIFNEITKFFWEPHTQIFNIFIPVMSLYLFRWMQPRLSTLKWSHMIVIGLLLGLGNLAYGAFAVAVGGAVLAILMGEGIYMLRAAIHR